MTAEALRSAEDHAERADVAADAAWLAWARAAVARGVRCDVSLADVPLVIDRGRMRIATTTEQRGRRSR